MNVFSPKRDYYYSGGVENTGNIYIVINPNIDMKGIGRKVKIALLTAVVALLIVIMVLPSGYTTHPVSSIYAPSYSSVSSTTAMPWFFDGAYLNFSIVELASPGKGVGYANESIVSTNANNGTFEVKTTSFIADIFNIEYENYSPSNSVGSFFLNSTDLSSLNAGNSSLTPFGSGFSAVTVQTAYKFTDNMGTFTTDKITAYTSGLQENIYVDQHAGVIVGISTFSSDNTSSSSFPFHAIYGNLTSTNIHTSLSSTSSYILYYAIGGIAGGVIVIVAVVAYSLLRKKHIAPPGAQQ